MNPSYNLYRIAERAERSEFCVQDVELGGVFENRGRAYK